MILIFQRTGQRRYAIQAKRPGLPEVVMDPAPGYDPFMPHDLLHLVVEAQLGLNGGVFGQLNAGGNAGTFHPISDGSSARAGTRGRRHMNRRGKTLMREGRADSSQSERATYICWYEWLTRSPSDDRRKVARAMSAQANHIRGTAPAAEMRALGENKIERICRHLDELSSHWSRLSVGEFMAVRWPDLAVSSNTSASEQSG
jgi:hypothetical protein